MSRDASAGHLVIEGRAFLLNEDPGVAERDREDFAVTLIDLEDGSELRIYAKDLLDDAYCGRVGARKYHLRELAEELVRLKFDREWQAEIFGQVKKHHLLELKGS